MTTPTPTTPSIIDLRLATKGRNQPLQALLEQAKISLGLAAKYATTLATAAWTDARSKAMTDEIDALEGDVVSRIDAANVAHHATQKQQDAIDEAKEFVRKLRAAAPMVLRDTKIEGVPVEAFHGGGTLNRSVPKIQGYLLGVKGPLAKLDAEFAPYFGGKSPSALLDDVAKALDGADLTQEMGIKSLPDDTLHVYETKGRLLENIEDLNRIAKIAFDGDARARALFNKDILLRAHKAAKQATTAPTDASTTDKTATTSPTPAGASDTKTATTSPSGSSSSTTKTATLEPQSTHV